MEPSATLDVTDPIAPHLPEVASELSWLEYANNRAEVNEFCLREGIGKDIRVCTDLVKKHFNPFIRIEIYLGDDPEGAGEWIVVLVLKHCTVPEASDLYDRFLDDWIDASSPDVRSRIRFVYRAG